MRRASGDPFDPTSPGFRPWTAVVVGVPFVALIAVAPYWAQPLVDVAGWMMRRVAESAG
jgi:hypothetical protein